MTWKSEIGVNFRKFAKNRRFFKCYTFVSDFKLRKPYYLHYCLQVFVTSVKKWVGRQPPPPSLRFTSCRCSIFEITSKVIVFPQKEQSFLLLLCQIPREINFSVSERVAVKIIDKGKLDGKTQKMVTREINIMDSLSHPNLIRYLS